MRMAALVAVAVLGTAVGVPPAVFAGAPQVEYAALWQAATPFHAFLDGVKARAEQWRSTFANAAVDAEALTRARALPARRRILVVAEDRCSDSAWAVPYLAKLAAAVPEKLELRVLSPADGNKIQSAHLTPDGRLATPTIAVLDEQDRLLGAWVERPSDLQRWYLDEGSKQSRAERYDHLTKWYTADAGKTTIREVLAILERTERKQD